MSNCTEILIAAGDSMAAWIDRAAERWEQGDLAGAVREMVIARREWDNAKRKVVSDDTQG